MSPSSLILLLLVYVAGLSLIRRTRQGLAAFMWGAFGFGALLILIGQAAGWHESIGSVEAAALAGLGTTFGLDISTLGPATLVVSDPTGWSILRVGVECSTLVEGAVFSGLMLFYPRFTRKERFLRLAAGLGGTFLVNTIRLALIVAVIVTLGKGAAPLAHTVLGRLVFFVGIVIIYWKLFTLPTLNLVRKDLSASMRLAT